MTATTAVVIATRADRLIILNSGGTSRVVMRANKRGGVECAEYAMPEENQEVRAILNEKNKNETKTKTNGMQETDEEQDERKE